MPTTTTGSTNISILDSSIVADLCAGIFYVDITPSTFIGSGADNILGASVKIVSPYGVTIKNYPTSGYDIYPDFEDSIEVDIPTQANNFQYGNYVFTVQLTDADGTIFTIEKSVPVKQPDAKNKTRKYGSLSADLNGVCLDGKLYITADTPPTYNGAISDSQVNDLTLEFPTSSGLEERESTLNTWSDYLFEGVYKLTGTICAHYSFGDNVFANVNYKVKKEKNIRCLLDETCVYARLSQLNDQLNSDCSDKEKIATQNDIIQALFLLKTIEVAIKSGYDGSDYIDQLEKVLGCVCTCNCAEGTPIINTDPTPDVSITGCNVEKVTVGLTDTYTIDNYEYIVDIAQNGNAITIETATLNDCTKTQIITFNLSIVYTQIKAQVANTTEYNFWASVINRTLDSMNLTCVGSPAQWSTWTFAQRYQWLINNFCVGGTCNAVIASNSTTVSGSDVIVDWESISGTYEVAIYMDYVLVGTVLQEKTVFTIEGAADGNAHTYMLVSKCINGIIGTVLSGSFTYLGCPTIAVPTVSSANVVDATCPYDLTALVDTLPLGISAEWHTLNNTSPTSLVSDATAATGGVYYVFAKNSAGCYSLGVQVTLTCSTATACTAPQTLIVEAITGGFRVRFNSATFPPPLNSYTVKRRLKSSPDISGSYTTIGTPSWNMSANKWEILDATAVNNTLYVYRAISNCTSSAPYADYEFANLSCPTVTLTPDDEEMDYSFTNAGGEIDKYEVQIYESDEVTLIHTDTKVPAFASPITGTLIYLTPGQEYAVRLKVFIGTYSKTCDFQSVQTTGGDEWSISNTNNDSSISMALIFGDNNTSPSYTLYTGLYSSDPVTGTDATLPATNANVLFNVGGGRTIISASCNGVPGTITGGGSTVNWSGVNGSVRISFIVAEVGP